MFFFCCSPGVAYMPMHVCVFRRPAVAWQSVQWPTCHDVTSLCTMYLFVCWIFSCWFSCATIHAMHELIVRWSCIITSMCSSSGAEMYLDEFIFCLKSVDNSFVIGCFQKITLKITSALAPPQKPVSFKHNVWQNDSSCIFYLM